MNEDHHPVGRPSGERGTELLPCPFCGEHLQLSPEGVAVRWWKHPASRCPGMVLQSIEAWPEMDQDAIAAWNRRTRTPERALLDRIEELEGALRPFVDLVKSHDDAGVSFLRSDQADAAARLTYDELAELFAPAHEVPLTDGAMRSPIKITWGDFRRARKALSGEKP